MYRKAVPHSAECDLKAVQHPPRCFPTRNATAQRGARDLVGGSEGARGKDCPGVRTMEEAWPKWCLGRSGPRQRACGRGIGLPEGHEDFLCAHR